MVEEDGGGGHVVEPHFKFYEEQLGFPRGHTKLTTNGKMDWHRCRNQSDSWLPEFRYSL